MTDLPLPQQFQRVLQHPAPEEIQKLQAVLLALNEHEAVQKAYPIVGQYYRYMVAMQGEVGIQQFSDLASQLAGLGKGVSISKNIFDPNDSQPIQTESASLQNVLNVLGNYSFIQQWDSAFATFHGEAVWPLFEYYWQMSEDLQPYLNLGERGQSMSNLFGKLQNPATRPSVRVVTILQLYLWAFSARMYQVVQLYNQLVGGGN